MKNEFFDISFDPETGCIASIVHPADPHRMNWCAAGGAWGMPRAIRRISSREFFEMELTAFSEREDGAVSVYSNGGLLVTAERFFTENGRLRERFTLKNPQEDDLFFNHGELKIELPLPDEYPDAEECAVRRCHAHLWCGGSVSYVNALKMAPSPVNLGLVLTEGALASYSVADCKSNHRGVFLLDCEHLELLPGEETVIEWELFWHTGAEAFAEEAARYPRFLRINADRFTVFDNEEICFTAEGAAWKGLRVRCDGAEVPLEGGAVRFRPKRTGAHIFEFSAGDLHTRALFFVSEPIETVVEKRLRFIVEHQQYHRTGSRLDGAFLIYDNEEKTPVFSAEIRDHNACRERVGMALLLVRYLRKHSNAAFEAALKRYLDFLFREVFDPETGEVFDGVGRNKKFVRLYNAPWIATLFTELYALTGDQAYLYHIVKLLGVYYDGGGARFYPNGFSMYDTVRAFEKAGLSAEAEQVRAWFRAHADQIAANGTRYPKHEVNFEQTIVTPAVTLLAEFAALSGEDRYRAEAAKHLGMLERFNGSQPDFRLHGMPIRYWDDYWFGKARLFGDTFPHYWSILTARAYLDYYRVSGEERWLARAESCARNCLCLFNEKGGASCAYVYPFESNGQKGAFCDPWANDQDFALYFYLKSDEFFRSNL